jgi:hypothetical protein
MKTNLSLRIAASAPPNYQIATSIPNEVNNRVPLMRDELTEGDPPTVERFDNGICY